MRRLGNLLLVVLLVSLTGTVFAQQQAQPKKKAAKKPGFTWEEYLKLCGNSVLEREQNFEQVKGKTILWKGKYAESDPDMALKDDRTWASDVLRVKMEPSEGLLADIKLRIPKGMANKAATLRTGDDIVFKGKIMYIGNKITDHIIEVEDFKKLGDKEGDKSKPGTSPAKKAPAPVKKK